MHQRILLTSSSSSSDSQKKSIILNDDIVVSICGFRRDDGLEEEDEDIKSDWQAFTSKCSAVSDSSLLNLEKRYCSYMIHKNLSVKRHAAHANAHFTHHNTAKQ